MAEKREMVYRQAFATIEGELYPGGEFFGIHHVEGWFRARVYFQGIKTEEDFIQACKRISRRGGSEQCFESTIPIIYLN